MATKFEELINEMVNVSIGVAATAVEKTQEMTERLSAKGDQVRHDHSAPDFARSMFDIFEEAGGTFSDVTERLSSKGESAAERVLDELIFARVPLLTKTERVEFMAHVRDLVDSVDDATVTVEVECDDAAEGSGDIEGERDE